MSVADMTLTVPGLSNSEQDTLNRLYSQLLARRPRNLLRSAYYEFRNLNSRVSPIIPPIYQRMSFVLGWTGKAVDALGQRCTLENVVWPDGDLDSSGYSEFRDANHLQATVRSATFGALQHGVSFLINTRGVSGEPSSLLHHKDALNATGEWNSRRRHLDNLLSVNSWSESMTNEPSSFTLYLDGLTITATRREGGGWSTTRQAHPWGVPVEAVMHKPWARTYGASRITRPMMNLQDSAVRALMRLEAHMDIYAIPDMILLGADNSIFKNADGSTQTAWQVMMGRLKGIPDDEDAAPGLERADVKQFPAQSPKPHLDAINAFAKLFAREADLPDSSLAIEGISNPTSADSYIESRESLIAGAETLTDDLALPVKRAVARGLAIQSGLGEVPAEWRSFETMFRPPAYLSRAQAADAGAKQLAAGPDWLRETEVGLELLGLSPQQVRRAQAERRRANGRSLAETLAGAARDDAG